MLMGFVCHLSVLGGLAISIFKHALLPEKFFFDETRITGFMNDPSLLKQAGSYQGTTYIYRMLGAEHLGEVGVSVLGFVLYLIFLHFHFPMRGAVRSPLLTALYALACGLGAIFVTGYTKEAVLVAVMLAFPRVTSTRRREALFLGLAVAYGVGVRQYWVLIVALYLFYRLLAPKLNRFVVFFITLVPLLAFTSLVFRYVLNVNLHYYRTSVIENLSVTPGSVIVDPVAGASIWADLVNGVFSVITLAFPVPLIFASESQLPVFLVIAAIWGLVFGVCVVRHRQIGTSLNRHVAFVFAYLVVLSLFEPDYGSYLRHLSAVLPVILSIIMIGLASSEERANRPTGFAMARRKGAAS